MLYVIESERTRSACEESGLVYVDMAAGGFEEQQRAALRALLT